MAALQGFLSNPKLLSLPSNPQRSRLKLLGSCNIGTKWSASNSRLAVLEYHSRTAVLSRGRLTVVDAMAVAEEFGKVEEGGVKTEGCVKAVFFDLDDTLVLTHAADTVAQAAVLVLAERRCPNVNGEEMMEIFVKGIDVSPWDPTHQVDVVEWRSRLWANALRSQGIEDMDLARDMQRLFDKERLLSFQWAPGVEAMVQTLHKAGIKLGVITNGHFSVQRDKLKACKANLLFDIMLVGGEEPHQKPHKDIFLKACRLAGCNPEESIMVGDNLKTDIQGGKNAGFIATVWVNLHNLEGVPPGGSEPDYIISSIQELPGLLRTLKVDLGSSD